MYIKKAHIKNFRGMESLDLQFKPGFNLIKGVNGTGKTSILEALSIGLSCFSGSINPDLDLSFSENDVRKKYQFVKDGAFTSTSFYPVQVDIDVDFGKSIGLFESKLGSSNGVIHCACVSSDRKRLAIGVDDCIEVWSLEDQSFEHQIQLSSPATAVAMIHDSNNVMVALTDSTIRVLDIATGMIVGKVMRWPDAEIRSINILDDGKTAVICANKNLVRICNEQGIVNGNSIYIEGGIATATALHNHCLYIGTDSGLIEKYSINKTTDSIAHFQGHENTIRSLAVSNDGRILASSSDDATIRIWNTDTKKCIHVIDMHGYVVSSLSISFHQQMLIGGASDHKIYIWDMNNGEVVKILYGASWPIEFASFFHNDEQIVGFGERDDILVWNMAKSEVHMKKELSAKGSSTLDSIVSSLAKRLYVEQDSTLPVLSYQGAGRVWAEHTVDNVFLTRRYEREDGYTHSLNGKSDVQLLLAWCIMMDLSAYQWDTKIIEYEAVKNIVARFMQSMDHGSHYSIRIDRKTFTPMFTEGDLTLPIHNLSIGYQSLIWMVFDIAFRMAVLNPRLRGNIAETPGIVLIDEIDIHLHTKWQWKVIDALRKTFPNVQFIATTHSPVLFAAAKDVWLIDIDQEEPKYSSSIYGLDISNSVDIYQGKYSVPEEIGQMVQEFYDAMDDCDHVKAKDILDTLETMFSIETPLLVDLKTMYAFESDINKEE